ncbi:MAG: hypothetical protein LQ351_002611 [Letrouitia transgressa]|nr:MAG: hypothetical protein LQ351_002611 [Letrouitia transgressa]
MEESLSADILASWHQYRHIFLAVSVLAVFALSFWRWQKHRVQRLSTSLIISSNRKSVDHNAPSRFSGSEKHIVTSRVLRQSPKRVIGSRPSKIFERHCEEPLTIQPLIFFSSLTGTTEKYVSKLVGYVRESRRAKGNILDPQIEDLSVIDYDDFFVTPPKTTSTEKIQYFYLFLIPSYNIDTILNNFLAHLKEIHHDFRIDTAPLSGLAGYSVFGFGDREGWPTEQEGFCRQAAEVDKWMAKLTSRKRAFPLGMGDVTSDANNRLIEWAQGLSKVLEDISEQGGLGDGVVGSGDAIESGDEDLDDSASSSVKKRRKEADKPDIHDLEDLGGQGQLQVDKTSLAIDFTTTSQPLDSNIALDMVSKSSPTYAALTKQGYTIVGSHSGVKICRWTKSALRGRGSCYKYSFYGIKSHLCMETTPSLSCSNKCVFCWRHGTNPVGTIWRWKVDPPNLIFNGAKEAHLKKIRMMKGVPGVRAERFQEAMKIRHCALSLVGEPIFYPHINEFLRLLHAEKISSFLVCNAQHPEELDALDVVTQLYVSIDASNKDSLKKVDRPLHRDFWDRFLKCLDILRDKRFRMRTVYRLTLVKGFNIENEVEGYANLVERGLPCFVEIKGVTYCGTSSSVGAGLTMTNVPFYEEVVAFVKALESALGRRGLEYGIAAEHAHSCCVLIASTRFLIGRVWHTLIDYDKFFECLESGKEFSPEDYVGPPTPHWATFGNGGFDPSDERVYRKGKGGKKLENT